MADKDRDKLLEARVHTSQLLGKNKSLVLHGGGNTSVKIREKNLLGEEEDILYVKGSGWDLETITANGFSPVRLEHLKKLSNLPSLSDSEMVNELVTHLTRASAPVPSVEAILHAVIPYTYVDHTHADAVRPGRRHLRRCRRPRGLRPRPAARSATTGRWPATSKAGGVPRLGSAACSSRRHGPILGRARCA